MPYINGVRVSAEEWQRVNGSSVTRLHTGPNGENPAPGPELDPETQAPKAEKKAGKKRSARSKATIAAAVADATGAEAPDLDLDVTDLDADGDAAEDTTGGDE